MRIVKIMLAALVLLAGIGTFIGLNFVLAFAYGMACGASQFLNVLLRVSAFAWAIKLGGWLATAWLGIAVFNALR